MRKHAFRDGFKTLYLGGGTPSLLDDGVLIELFEFLKKEVDFSQLQEISMEANPETLSKEKLILYQELGINRMTLGIQSFNDQNLKWLGRNHGSKTLLKAKELLLEFRINLGLDLMFGFEGQTWVDLELDLRQALEFHPNHISLYGLTIEEGTLFGQREQRGETLINENAYNELFQNARDWLQAHGFVQYELSNFAKAGFESKHNRAYWTHTPYLGLGPGAHSLQGRTRSWNSKNWNTWIKSTEQQLPQELEILEDKDWNNESIWLQLRQSQGLPDQWLSPQQKEKCQALLNQGKLLYDNSLWKIPLAMQGIMDEITTVIME